MDEIEPIRRQAGKPGRPRKRPAKLHADKGYDFPRCRKVLRERGIKARIARRGKDTRSHLINIWPASETMLPESIESHKWRENAAGSACLSQSNLLLPYL